MDVPIVPQLRETAKCYVCAKNEAKYSCPKCGCRYCSIDCYQGHSKFCTERFYQQNVQEFLESQVASEEIKNKTIEMLNRLSLEDKEEEEAEILEKQSERYASILQQIDNNENIVDIWSNFTEEEKKEFEKNIFNLYSKDTPQFVPWYYSNTDIPKAIPNIVPIDTLIGKSTISPNLHIYLFDILFSYCYIYQLYEGDWCDIADVVENILCISHVLSPYRSDCLNYISSPESTIEMILNSSTQHPFSNPKIFGIQCLLDVKAILSNREYVLSALSHLIMMMRRLQSVIKKKNIDTKRNDNVGTTTDDLHTIFKVKKKLEFYLSWYDNVPIGSPSITQLLQSITLVHTREEELLK